MRNQMIGAIGALAVGGAALANNVSVQGGQTNVVLDFDTLAAAASLELSSVSGDVIAPGSVDGSVAFPIVDAGSFGYEVGDFLGTFGGSIEHIGLVNFNADTVTVGDFSIGFDADRVGGPSGTASGFFVESTAGIAAILFDVAAPSELAPLPNDLIIGADLLVSPEFGAFLFDNGLSDVNLEGAVVGSALVEGDNGCTGVDLSDNGRVNFIDVLFFVDAYLNNSADADFDGDGMASFGDLQVFVDRFLDCRRH